MWKKPEQQIRIQPTTTHKLFYQFQDAHVAQSQYKILVLAKKRIVITQKTAISFLVLKSKYKPNTEVTRMTKKALHSVIDFAIL
jgi:hypothetical protein